MSEPTDEDEYANNYCHFQNSLKILSHDAEAQCQAMDYFNVAWEIKDEAISNGYAVLSTVDTQLSEQQKDRINKLLENVADIPDSVVNVLNSREAHLRTMSDPCWIPIRALAKQLIAILSAETDRVDVVLNIKRP
ncbi:hypothetical protein LQ948_18570 [Jiella sp. MQZ9-1]|uniref:Uncharacterized protein n=1 Tax=Jiella flava TaxID=2816857 RepID=A0A939JYM5_9HYPH|nr:hypothetical protein [Jiella flava]MBO0664566.1 hypothetical protein [Jiella flava]MCD2473199.1 hypothetical protein [Jiella flava]